MAKQNIIIEFENLNSRDANQKSLELKSLLEETALTQGVEAELDAKIIKKSASTQDFGATLLLILGTPAAAAVAKGLYNYISKFGDEVRIITENGSVIARGSGAANIDVAKTISALTTHSDTTSV